MCAGATIAAALLLSLADGSAAARPPPSVRLIYSRAPGASVCPDEATVRGAVASRLEADPFREPADLVIHAALASEAGGGLKAHLEVSSAAGEPRGGRDLVSDSDDCVELASAMELAISIAINPFLLMPAPQHPPDAPPRPASPPPAPSRPASPPAPARPPPVRAGPTPAVPASPAPGAVRAPPAKEALAFEVELGVATSLGASPGVTGGANLGAALRYSLVQVGIEGRADLPTSTGWGAGSVSSALVMGSLVPCVRSNRAGVCVVASGGAALAWASNLPGARRTTAPYSAVGARVFADLPVLAAIALRFQVDVRVATTRPSLDAGDTPVWEMPLVSGTAGICGTLRLP